MVTAKVLHVVGLLVEGLNLCLNQTINLSKLRNLLLEVKEARKSYFDFWVLLLFAKRFDYSSFRIAVDYF